MTCADPAVRRIGKPNPDPTYPTYSVGDVDSDNGHRTEIRPEPVHLEDLLRRVISKTAADPGGRVRLSGQ